MNDKQKLRVYAKLFDMLFTHDDIRLDTAFAKALPRKR